MPQSLEALQHLLRMTLTELAKVEAKLLTTTNDAEISCLLDKAAVLHLKEQEIRAMLECKWADQ